MSASSMAVECQDYGLLARIADYIELSKPKICALVLLTVAACGYIARWGNLDIWTTLHVCIGTALVAASASAWNQYFERQADRVMDRTARRPIPAGRLSPYEVAVFGSCAVIFGLAYLLAFTSVLTTIFGALTWVMYVCIYTPLKMRTEWNTAVGAVAGAAPVAIGWFGCGGSASDMRFIAIILLVFLWQFPHFMAIAWLYRRQYARAGMQMMTVVEPTGRRAGVQAALGALSVMLVSLVPATMTPDAELYLAVAFILGAVQLVAAVRFLMHRSDDRARTLLRATLAYLPGLLIALVATPA